MRFFLRVLVLVCVVVLSGSAMALADPIVCDLRTADSCTINGGIFTVFGVQPAGTGVIDSFVRIEDKNAELGYNTSFRPVQFDEKTDPNFTRDLRLSDVGITTIGGVPYATFFLDINESSAGNKEAITLDQVEVFTSSLTLRTGYTGVPNTASGALPGTTKIYDLDSDADHYIQLSYDRLSRGSGESDMAFYLPLSLFTGTHVNLFSQFGNIDGSPNKIDSDAGF